MPLNRIADDRTDSEGEVSMSSPVVVLCHRFRDDNEVLWLFLLSLNKHSLERGYGSLTWQSCED